MKINVCLAWAVLFSSLGLVPRAAADLYWDTNGAAAGGSAGTTAPGTWGVDNFWSTSAAGTAATSGWTAGETAVFSAGTNVTGTYDVTLDGSQDISGIRFEEGHVSISGGAELVIPGSVTTDFNGNGVVDAADYVIWRKHSLDPPGTGTPATGDANGDLNVDATDYDLWRGSFGNVGGGLFNVAAANATINSTISGAGRLTKTGTGTLTLTGANTYDGGTSITAGKLSIANFASLGTPPGANVPDRVQISGGATLSSTEPGLEFLTGPFAGITFGSGAGTIEITDPDGQRGITATVSGSEKWTKSGPGEFQLRNNFNPFTGGFKVTGGTLSYAFDGFEGSGDTAPTLRSTGAAPADVVSDYVILDGGALKNNNAGVGSTFLATRKGISLGANGGTIIHDENPAFNQITIYFGKISLLPGVTQATLTKRGRGEFRSDKTSATDDAGWDQTQLIVEEGLFRIGHFSEETVLGQVPATYKADAVVLNGQGTTRSTGAAAIGLTSFDASDPANQHNAITTTPATRGITLGANGGTICTSIGTNSWVFESIITGPGGIHINGNGFPVSGAGAFATATSNVVFKGANTYLGDTHVNSGFLVVDGANAKLGAGNVFVDGVTPDIVDGGAADVAAAGKLRILTGVNNAIADTATLTLTGGGTPDLADVGYIDLGDSINEVIASLVLAGNTLGAGQYGSTASGALNPGLTGLGLNPDEFFAGMGVLTVSGVAAGLDAGTVPEPSTALLLAVGLAGISLRRRRD